METTLFSELINARNYTDYKELVLKLAEAKDTTGTEKTSERIEATVMNAQRMKRIDKQVNIRESIQNMLESGKPRWDWILLTEAWCGDGAQNIPIIAKIAELAPGINLKIILRDENPEIMDAYLTNGSRSIPKLICLDTESKEEIGTWGSRPSGIQQKVVEYKAANPNVDHDEFVKNVHLWYGLDKGEALQDDFERVIKQWLVL